MAKHQRGVIGGVDTHGKTHHVAALDGGTGRLLGDQEFPATGRGYADLLRWLQSFGRVVQVGIEGTGSYGAGLFRYFDSQRISVIEVDRPNRRTRRKQGKSDPIDAIAAARAVLAGTVSTTPKARSGAVEAIRVLRIARTGAVKARTAALNQLASLIVSAPQDLRRGLNDLSRVELISHCTQLRIDENRLADPVVATKAALRTLARRVQALDAEIGEATTRLTVLVTQTAPATSAIYGAGPEVTGQLLTTAGDNPDRIHTEAALARLCGTAPIPASSGNTDRHRLHRGGDRAANSAVYRIVLTRLGHHHQPTCDYMQRRTQQGKTRKEIIRCLKRAIIREIYTALKTDFTNLGTAA
jgi:transposase